jgi:hypothetical protein
MNAIVDKRVDPAKITGMYPLLGAILAVLELGLGYWFVSAADRTERIVAGSLMVGSLLTFLVMVVYWNLKKGEESEQPTAPGIGKLNLPDKQATAEQINEQLKSPEAESYVAPNRSYIINRPPEDWVIKELTVAQWSTYGLNITDDSLVEKLGGKDKDPKDIVVFETKSRTLVSPIPGTTIFDGRKLLTALGIELPTSLGILPLNRAQPPLFVERPLLHNFMQVVSELLALGVMTLHKLTTVTIPDVKRQRQRWVAELSQVIDNAIVNGQAGMNVKANILVIGLEGDIQDYILLMQYPSLKDAEDSEMSRNQQILNSLMSSLRPITVPDFEAVRKGFKAKADQNFEQMMKEKGEALFTQDFIAFLYKFSGKDLNNLDNRLKAMNMLKPFKSVAEQINLHDEELDELWQSLQEAEEGNTLSFKENLENMIEKVKGGAVEGKNVSPDIEERNEIAINEGQGSA